MKNTFKHFVFIAMFTIMELSFTAPVHAGGIVDRIFNGGAKNLAKQTMELAKYAADIEKRTTELQAKVAEVEEKTAALSAKDRRTFQAELARLGFKAPDWLFGDVEALASGTTASTPTPAPAPTTVRSSGSPNLDTWTAVVDSTIWQYANDSGQPATASINAIAFGNNRFVAVAGQGRMAYADW
jgi:hypothetical protein